MPVQIAGDKLLASPFASARLAGGTISGQPPLGDLVLAKLPSAGSMMLSCLTGAGTVRCELLLARESAGRSGLAYAGSASVPPAAQAAGASSDNDHATRPPAAGTGLSGSGAVVGGSASAAAGAAGAAAAAVLLLAVTLLLGAPHMSRRLLDVCERWLASPLALVLERPD